MISPYTAVQVTVYRSIGGKTFYTRPAAMKRSAWDLIKRKCKCWQEQAEGDETGAFIPCPYHGDNYERGLRVAERLIRAWKREEKRARDAIKEAR